MACGEYVVIFSAIFAFFLASSLVAGETCTSPKVESRVYTTSEEQMSTETVVVVELTLSCQNGAKGLNLYADFNGRTSPVSRVTDSDHYQVSFTEEHKKLPSGRYRIRFFDEELYTDLRKAQRSGEGTSTAKSLFEVDVRHQGASRGPWVQSEHIATGAAILVWYIAYTLKNRLQS